MIYRGLCTTNGSYKLDALCILENKMMLSLKQDNGWEMDVRHAENLSKTSLTILCDIYA